MDNKKRNLYNKKLTDQQIIDGVIEEPISKFYGAYDTDLARDNLQNDIPNADLQDL